MKEKTQSAGRVKDILVKAGGGATDPHGDDDSENGPVNEGNVEGKKPSQHVSAPDRLLGPLMYCEQRAQADLSLAVLSARQATCD